MTGEVLSQRQLNRALLARQLLLERASLTIAQDLRRRPTAVSPQMRGRTMLP